MAKGKKDDDLVKIVYVGKKPYATDNVAHSGKSWNGRGDVQEVTLRQASMLCRFPDQWQVVDGKPLPDEKSIEQKLAQLTPPKPGGVGVAGKRLDDMDERELADHALYYYEVTLDPKLGREEMLDRINEAVRTAGQDAEFARNQEITGGAGAFGGAGATASFDDAPLDATESTEVTTE